jgi:hypothetical protein
MPKLAGAALTVRGVVAFWLLWCSAFVLMLWVLSPGRTLQDALTAELLQGHLAGGYQLPSMNGSYGGYSRSSVEDHCLISSCATA